MELKSQGKRDEMQLKTLNSWEAFKRCSGEASSPWRLDFVIDSHTFLTEAWLSSSFGIMLGLTLSKHPSVVIHLLGFLILIALTSKFVLIEEIFNQHLTSSLLSESSRHRAMPKSASFDDKLANSTSSPLNWFKANARKLSVGGAHSCSAAWRMNSTDSSLLAKQQNHQPL